MILPPLSAALPLLLFTVPAFAQANDDCANATPISGEGLFAFDTSSATTDDPVDCLEIFDDVWFSWTAPASETYAVDTCGLLDWDWALEAQLERFEGQIGLRVLVRADSGSGVVTTSGDLNGDA